MRENEVIVPKIVFDVSWIYYRIWKNLYQGFSFGAQYPEYEEIAECGRKMEEYWNQKKRGILKEIAFITGLKWTREIIPCFVIGPYPGAFSHPLTISSDTYAISPKHFLGILIHELIHNIFIDNVALSKDRRWVMAYLDEKYGEEASYDLKIHILVHAIHAHIHSRFIDKDLKTLFISRNPDYQKSWEIIQEEGYENIIHDFADYVRELRQRRCK